MPSEEDLKQFHDYLEIQEREKVKFRFILRNFHLMRPFQFLIQLVLIDYSVKTKSISYCIQISGSFGHTLQRFTTIRFKING